MRTFLSAMCILLALLAVVLVLTRLIVGGVGEMVELAATLPRVGEAGCLDAVAHLEARWGKLRPLLKMALSGQLVVEIDRLVVTLRVMAAEENAADYEGTRGLLLVLLEEVLDLSLFG